jgi:hypothetical protein
MADDAWLEALFAEHHAAVLRYSGWFGTILYSRPSLQASDSTLVLTAGDTMITFAVGVPVPFPVPTLEGIRWNLTGLLPCARFEHRQPLVQRATAQLLDRVHPRRRGQLRVLGGLNLSAWCCGVAWRGVRGRGRRVRQ